MREIIKQVLSKLECDFKDDNVAIFANPKKFRAVLNDIQIETDAKRVRHLLNLAVRDMQIYSRLESELGKNSFIIDNLAVEMSSDYFVDKDLSKTVIECFAELLGYSVKVDIPKTITSEEVTVKSNPPTEQSEVSKDLQAEYEQGIVYYNGHGVEKDFFKAEHYLLRPALNGHVEAQCALGDLFADETNPNIDPTQAVEWYYRAADAGHPKAQWMMGACYSNGIGIEKNIDEAKYWFKQLADQRNPDGQYGLASCYMETKDYKEAERYLRRAAAQGHMDAKAMLEQAAPLFQ